MLYNEVQLNVELDGNARYKCPEELENPGGPLSGVRLQARPRGSRTSTPWETRIRARVSESSICYKLYLTADRSSSLL